MRVYQINFSDGSTAMMQILDDTSNIDAEIAKWGSPIKLPDDPSDPQTAYHVATVTSYAQIS